MKIYTSHRSNAAFQVRIGLAYKGLSYESEYVRLDETTGESRDPEYLLLNPSGMVPVLMDGRRIYRQALAILEYLEEVFPDPPILPGTSRDRERIRSLSQAVSRDIDPLTDPRVMAYLENQLDIGRSARAAWEQHWHHAGLMTLERLIEDNPATSRFCHGEMPTMSDICTVPQVYAAEQAGCDLERYPTVAQIYRTCMELAAFKNSAPHLQPDA